MVILGPQDSQIKVVRLYTTMDTIIQHLGVRIHRRMKQAGLLTM